MKLKETILILLLAGVMAIVGNTLSYNMPAGEAAVGYVIMVAIAVVGMVVARLFPIKLPMVFWISIIAVLSTTPISPIAKMVTYYTGKVDFLALTTPILAYAGLSVGKDLASFQKISWRIVVVSLCVYTGTFLFATMIAQIMLKFEGII
ncbi:MAG: hypothetical protein P4N41_05175 [Negativicutes bacterium]|nr:hypothetical protein [Negativicutes bacterium]